MTSSSGEEQRENAPDAPDADGNTDDAPRDGTVPSHGSADASGDAGGKESSVAEAAVAVEDAPVFDPAFPRFNETMTGITGYLQHNFIFRKLGVAYDYVSLPGKFPRHTLPTQRDTRDNTPNSFGIGTGMGDCTRNTCLLLDAYLARLELGLGDMDDDRVMDRLVGGLIRLGTLGPRGVLSAGVTADGRGVYPVCPVAHHTHYGHGMLRAVLTPAIQPESQEKIRDICGKWASRLQSDDFKVAVAQGPGVELDLPADAPESADTWLRNLRMFHIVCVASEVNGGGEWRAMYGRFVGEEQGRRVGADLPPEIVDPDALVDVQTALSDIATVLERQGGEGVDALRERVATLRAAVARRAAAMLGREAQFSAEEPVEDAALDWRADLPAGDAPEEELRTRTLETWPRLGREATTVRPAAAAAFCVALGGDDAFFEESAAAVGSVLDSVPWTQLWDVGPLAPALIAHATGHEKGLWDVFVEQETELESVGARFGVEFDGTMKKILDEAKERDRKSDDSSGDSKKGKGGSKGKSGKGGRRRGKSRQGGKKSSKKSGGGKGSGDGGDGKNKGGGKGGRKGRRRGKKN